MNGTKLPGGRQLQTTRPCTWRACSSSRTLIRKNTKAAGAPGLSSAPIPSRMYTPTYAWLRSRIHHSGPSRAAVAIHICHHVYASLLCSQYTRNDELRCSIIDAVQPGGSIQKELTWRPLTHPVYIYLEYRELRRPRGGGPPRQHVSTSARQHVSWAP